jgi:hypothetical protein
MNIPLHPTSRVNWRWSLLLCLLLIPCTACGGDESAAETNASKTEKSASKPQKVDSSEVERDILDVINAVTPLAATTPAPEKSAWYGRRHDLMERMRVASRAHGIAALRVFNERTQATPEVRRGLLDIAAHNAPEETSETLQYLVETYGEDLGLRTCAAELMGSATPELAISVLEPILLGQRKGKTHPQIDLVLGSWNKACITLERERIPVICEVAMDSGQLPVARHAATKLLGTMVSEQGRQALERLLIETGTDGMIRRFAAQSLVKTTETAMLCEIITRTLNLEQDPSFQGFLANLSIQNCP